MSTDELKADLRQYFADAQDDGMEALDVELRGKAVISELQNPAGLQEHTEPYEAGLEAILRDHEAEGALGLSIAAAAALAELHNPKAETLDGGYEPPEPTPPDPNAPVISGLDPSTFPINDDTGILTVSGSNFHPLSIISMNNLQRPTTWVSESEITCLIPSWPQPGPVSVTVDTAGMTSGQMTFHYTAAH